MAALTMWDILAGNAQPLNAPQPEQASYKASQSYKPAMPDIDPAEKERQDKLAAIKAAEEAAAYENSPENRQKNFLTNMYYGGTAEEDRRVLTQAEFENGWTDALGSYRQGSPAETRSEEELAAKRHNILSHDWYKAGMDQFTGSRAVGKNDFGDNIHTYGNGDIYDEAMAFVRANNGGKASFTPWINTFDHDRTSTYNLVRNADYNAFLGDIGGLQSNVDGYRDDSIAGWFKNAFAAQDQIRNRNQILRDLRGWSANEGAGAGLNKATDVMTKQYFDQLDLANKYGLTWEQAGAVANQNSNGLDYGSGSNVDPGGNAMGGNGMLSRQNSSWMDVLNRGGANNWDSLLGQYTYKSPLDWASMDNETVQTQFSDLFDSGGMFTQGKNRDLIYAKLMENMGRV